MYLELVYFMTIKVSNILGYLFGGGPDIEDDAIATADVGHAGLLRGVPVNSWNTIPTMLTNISTLVTRTTDLVTAITNISTLITRTVNLVSSISNVSAIKAVTDDILEDIFDPDNNFLLAFLKKVFNSFLGDRLVV